MTTTDIVRDAGAVPSSEAPAGRAPLTKRSPVLLTVLLLVNAVAIWGQAGWAESHITPAEWDWCAQLAMALAFAMAIELVGVYLAQTADIALAAGLPSGGLRWASYGVGVLAGAMNFDHFRTTGYAPAVAFAFLSASSPFLWGIWAKLRHRVAAGSGVRRGVRLSPARKFWHPWRSLQVIRLAAWEGIDDEDLAVRAYAMLREQLDAPTSPAAGLGREDIGRLAHERKTDDPSLTWGAIAKDFGVTERHLYDCRKAAGLA